MSPLYRRTSTVAIVTALAIAAPCAAWYVAGSRAAALEARRIEQEPVDEARDEAARLAAQLRLRLESLRQSESRRGPADYQTSPGFVLDNCSNQPRIDARLVEGSDEALIWTRFQLDEVGQLSVPAFAAGIGLPAGHGVQGTIVEELECAAASSRIASARARSASRPGRLVQSADGASFVGPFEWLTAPVRERPALLALRNVEAPHAVLTQGFVVLAEALDGILAEARLPARVFAGEPGEPTAALLLVGSQPWSIVVDASAAQAAASERASAVLRRFRITFGAGAGLAALAGVLIVALVGQSERLAVRRAQFAAAAAHELRTPLAGLQLYGEMLAEGRGDPEARARYARRIADEAARLGRVVSNVLGYSRLERGGPGLRVLPGDLGAAIADSVRQLAPELEARGLRVSTSIDDGLPAAAFDRDAVHQILQNLLDNAEKYTRDSPRRGIEVRLERGASGPVLSVVDRGPGVPFALRRRIFEPFVRNGDTSSPAGLGIGLAIVRGLARAQGAEVAHADEPGGGSRFAVAFRYGSAAPAS